MLHRSPEKRLMPGVWMAPGGHIEKGEGIFAAAQREIMEETGMQIRNLQIKACGMIYLHELNEELIIYLMTADYVKGKVKAITEHDGEFVWLEKEEIFKLPDLLAELPKVLDHVLSENINVVSYYAEYKKGNELVKFMVEQT